MSLFVKKKYKIKKISIQSPVSSEKFNEELTLSSHRWYKANIENKSIQLTFKGQNLFELQNPFMKYTIFSGWNCNC